MNPFNDASYTTPPGDNVLTMPLKDGDKLTGSVRPPTKKGTADLTEADSEVPTGGIAIVILAESFDRSKKAKDYTRPSAVDFTTVDDYNFALRDDIIY